MRMSFQVDEAHSGVFVYGPGFDPALDDFHRILDQRGGGLPDKEYLAALRKLALRVPDFIDVHGHIALYWHDRGQPKRALDGALRALGIANSRIPEGFSGRIEWCRLDNRPYLRAMHVALGAYARAGRHADAVALIELMLARNPDDNQGVRFLLGPQQLRAGMREQALATLQRDGGEYAPNFYELALCHLLDQDYVAAATAMRRGFAANGYIAEMLCGNHEPIPLVGWQRSPFDDVGTATDYFRSHSQAWFARPGLLLFASWLYNHPAVLAERAGLRECQDALAWESELGARQTWLGKDRLRFDAINDTLSRKIAVLREDRQGRAIWPWTARRSG